MRRCVLHIGMHKTGTSSIQETLSKNAAKLKNNHNITYLDGPINHGAFAAGFVDAPELFRPSVYIAGPRLEARLEWADRARAMVEGAVSNSFVETLVLSGERFSLLTYSEAERLIKTLRQGFDQVDVYAYVREPIGFASSAAQQCVKGGSTWNQILHQTLVDPKSEPTSAELWDHCSVLPRYRFRIEKYQQLLGANNVHIREYIPTKFVGQDVVLDFLEWAFSLPEPDITLHRNNEGLDEGYVHVLEAINRVLGNPITEDGLNEKRARTLVLVPKDIAGHRKFTFEDLDTERFLEIIQPDIEWLRSATKGAVHFTHQPSSAEPSALDLSVVAQALNAQTLRAEQSDIKMQSFRAFWKYEKAKDENRAEVLGEIKAIISRCWEVPFLLNVAYHLTEMNEGDTAVSAINRAEVLTGEKSILERTALMRQKLVQRANS